MMRMIQAPDGTVCLVDDGAKGNQQGGLNMKTEEATEAAYKNGKEYMRHAVLSLLCEKKGKAMGQERQVIADIIDAVRKMEVRP